MKKTIIFVLLSLVLAGSGYADRVAVREEVPDVLQPAGIGGASGACSVVYYDVCSHWAWFWSGLPGDQIGVVFDLPADCGKTGNDYCLNTGFWWYWRFTTPSRGYVGYKLYEVDEGGCLIEPSLAEIGGTSPLERWNYNPGFGSFSADRVAIVATFPTSVGSALRVSTDNNVENSSAGCSGVPAAARSFWFGVTGQTAYCPPVPVTDPMGAVNLLVKAGFECGITAVPATRREESSWGNIKKLFR